MAIIHKLKHKWYQYLKHKILKSKVVCYAYNEFLDIKQVDALTKLSQFLVTLETSVDFLELSKTAFGNFLAQSRKNLELVEVEK